MNETNLDFQTLASASPGGGSWCDTFAYCLGVLTDPQTDFARQADKACATMSVQYDVEEQAMDEDGLRSYPDIIPALFHPVAPVTLALRWSPFPDALAALGEPEHLSRGKYANTVAVFRPVQNPVLPAATADERHFLFLLRHACERAFHSKRWVLLAGSPGWSYSSTDYIADDPDLQQLMADFGFVYFARKPGNA